MTDRIWNVWTLVLGLLGLVIFLALVVIGADLRRAKTRGPRWKRRIIAAGLAALAAAGAYPISKRHPYSQPESPIIRPMCYSMAVPLSPAHPKSPTPSDSPATEPSDSQSRVDLLRQFEQRGILAPPVADRARQQYTGEV